MDADPPPLLVVRDLAVRFGAVAALDGVSFDLPRGRITGLIGPNGAGKTSLLNCLGGLYPADRGQAALDGAPLLGRPRHAIAALGLGRTFQHLALFDRLSVRENLLVGAHARGRAGFLAAALTLPSARREERRLRGEVDALLAELDLLAFAEAAVAGLPLPVRKRVELGRALAGRPSLLLLDEPAAGLDPVEIDRLGDRLRGLRDRGGLTVLLVEHHLGLVMGVSDHVIALAAGRVLADGTPDDIRRHPDVVRAYLGAAP